MNAPSKNNPMYVSIQDHERLWATIFDVMDGHFDVEKSDPMRLHDDVLTEGRLLTKPRIAPSFMEPWHHDSGSMRERCDSTLQTIRHYAVVRVVPEQGGFFIEMHVYKELENRASPALADTSTGNLRFDVASEKLFSEIDALPAQQGWQLIDRDKALEEKLLGEILYRLDHPPTTIRNAQEPIRG